MNAYPLKLKAVLKDILWGGYKLGRFYHKPPQKIAEAWELTVHPEGINLIENGAYQGKSLADFLGTDRDFPVMIKLIDACDRLSIQVHPVKTEMWVILDCEPGASLVYGMKDKFDENAFRAALETNSVEDLLNVVPVHPGDVFFIPQGMVHAIGKGILICEIQQNSNVTYRVYDYGRLQNGKPRELHVEEAIKVIRDFTPEQIEGIRFSRGKAGAETLADCSLFRVDRLTVNGTLSIPEKRPFTSLVCIEGAGTIDGEPVCKGDSWLLPEGCGSVEANGSMVFLATTV